PTLPLVRSSVALCATRYVPPVWLGKVVPAEPPMTTVPVRTSMVPPRLLKRLLLANVWETPVPTDLRRVPALLKTPYRKSASPCRSYTPPAWLLSVPLATPAMASSRLPVPVWAMVPAFSSVPLIGLAFTPDSVHWPAL